MAKRIVESLPRAKGAGRMPPGPRKKPTQPNEHRVVISLSLKKWLRDTILTWPGPTITWDAVREALQKKHPLAVWQRQSIARHPGLQKAFRTTKNRLATEREERQTAVGSGKGRKSKSGTDEFFANRIQYLEARVGELEAENDKLKNQFIRWQRNAFVKAGLSIETLDKPLKRIDRGQANE